MKGDTIIWLLGIKTEKMVVYIFEYKNIND